jgi:hypothetical protein
MIKAKKISFNPEFKNPENQLKKNLGQFDDQIKKIEKP